MTFETGYQTLQRNVLEFLKTADGERIESLFCLDWHLLQFSSRSNYNSDCLENITIYFFIASFVGAYLCLWWNVCCRDEISRAEVSVDIPRQFDLWCIFVLVCALPEYTNRMWAHKSAAVNSVGECLSVCAALCILVVPLDVFTVGHECIFNSCAVLMCF